MTHECCAHADYWKASSELLSEYLREASSRIHKLEELMGPDWHVAQVKRHDVALQHPIACRRDLLGCPVHVALDSAAFLPPDDLSVGRYKLTLEDGELVFGESVDEEGYPINGS